MVSSIKGWCCSSSSADPPLSCVYEYAAFSIFSPSCEHHMYFPYLVLTALCYTVIELCATSRIKTFGESHFRSGCGISCTSITCDIVLNHRCACVDSYRALVLRPDWEKPYYRCAEAWLRLGDVNTAVAVNKSGREACSERADLERQYKEIQDLITAARYRGRGRVCQSFCLVATLPKGTKYSTVQCLYHLYKYRGLQHPSHCPVFVVFKNGGGRAWSILSCE